MVDRPRKRTPNEAYDELMRHGTPGRGSSAQSETLDAYGERREVSLEDWAPPRRGWIKYLAAAVVVGALAGGAWILFGRSAIASRASAAGTPPATAAPAVPAASTVAEKAAAVPPKDSAPAAAPRQEQPAPAPERAARQSATAGDQTDEAVRLPRRGAALPAVNLDRITKAIDDSARAKMDSAGRALNVNPPTFKPRSGGTPPQQR
ncbi:MAG TPA: hypothetical protein VMT93_03160 [Gemmatimonadaceae bacterium]|nr:hypothetical protein [Gemmatimonadaceae bacterium]